MSQRHRAGFIIILLFVLSITIRLPHLNRPLSRHYEWLTSTVLRNLQIWHEGGALRYKLCPIMTYDNKADKNINNQASFKDAKGDFYYTSYPPFAYIFPYLVFKSINVYPDVLPLQILNLAFHFVSSLFIFLIVSLLTKEYYVNKLNVPALLGFVVYLFSPATLWFQSNVYMSELFVQPLFIIGIYIFLKLVSGEHKKPLYYALLGVVNFFMVYTEWLGIFFALSVFIYSLFRKEKIIALVAATTSAASLALTTWQYSQISGFDAFFQSSVDIYSFRSGATQKAGAGLHYWDLTSWGNLAFYYAANYVPFLVVICVIVPLYFVLRKRLKNDPLQAGKRGAEAATLYLCAAPVILHHIVFFNFTVVHDFSVVKAGAFIAVATALFYHKLVNVLRAGNSGAINVKAVNLLVILMVIGSVLQYELINSTGHDDYKNIGQEIARVASENEVVFISEKRTYVPPQIVFYAHRNIAPWAGDSEAKNLLNLNDVERGIVFVVGKEKGRMQIIRTEYIHD